MKKRVFELFVNSTLTFVDLSKIEIVATFGSIINFQDDKFGDLDVISISNKKVHDKFISYLEYKFNKDGLRPIVFKTIAKKPKNIEEDQILIHDLNYKNLADLLKKEWPPVVNSMKKEMIIIHGDKNYPDTIPLLKVSRGDLFMPIIKWMKNINSREEFEIFQKYLCKIISKFSIEYSYLNFDDLDNIYTLIREDIFWHDKLKKIKIIIAKI